MIVGPPKQIQLTVQDTGGGLKTVRVLESINASVVVPTFAIGSTAPLVVSATQINQTMTAEVGLRIADRAGNGTSCAAILTHVGNDGPGGVSRSVTLHDVAGREGELTVVNDTPGIDRLLLVVNGQGFEVRGLADGETRQVDITSAMHHGNNNTISMSVQGGRGTATIVLS